MPNPGEARNNRELCLIVAKPGILENYTKSWQSQKYYRIMPNPGKARNIRDLCLILAKPGISEIFA
jgi:hypothetical protein